MINLRKITLFSLIRITILPLIMTSGSYSQSVMADAGSVQIQVSGVIVDAGCDISTNSTNAVVLGDFQASTFNVVGTTTQPKPLSISLTNCSSNIKGSSVYFSGTADVNDKSLLALSTTGTPAKGVAVQLLDSNNAVVAINTTSNVYTLKAGDNNLQFSLRYKSTLATVTAGDANAVLYFDMNYQ